VFRQERDLQPRDGGVNADFDAVTAIGFPTNCDSVTALAGTPRSALLPARNLTFPAAARYPMS
jgi:hypothetical protein